MWKKLAALISTSILVSSCQTAQYKPIICDPGYNPTSDGRCAKVPRIAKKATPRRVAQPAKIFDTPSWTQPPRQNEYGLPQT